MENSIILIFMIFFSCMLFHITSTYGEAGDSEEFVYKAAKVPEGRRKNLRG